MIGKSLKKAIVFCITIASIGACFAKPTPISPKSLIHRSDDQALAPGKGSFTFQDYKPFADRPIKVSYYNPNKPNAPILFVMHGNGRGAEGYFKAMLEYAKKLNFILIVPEFDAERFPTADYHHGGIFNKEKGLKNKEDWTFSLIEPLFDYVKKHTQNNSSGYYLYGFSAGSQFVHRFMMFNPENRAIRAISGSAGTYTMPDYNNNYSYGVKNVALPKKNLEKFYAKDFMVVVGDADTVLSRDDLVKTVAANKQGRDRVQRGITFYETSKAMAQELKVPFNWRPFRTIPHVGHSQGEMAEPIVKLLFDHK